MVDRGLPQCRPEALGETISVPPNIRMQPTHQPGIKFSARLAGGGCVALCRKGKR
jgi:hypothetical protein